jgi:hypothetical protein
LKEKPIRKFEGMLPSETLHSTLIKPRQEWKSFKVPHMTKKAWSLLQLFLLYFEPHKK